MERIRFISDLLNGFTPIAGEERGSLMLILDLSFLQEVICDHIVGETDWIASATSRVFRVTILRKL
jgi:hypothetical protein